MILTVDFITGAYRGAGNPAATAADWPPQIDRVFSALVAAWACRGKLPDDTAALRWLEQQPPPMVHAAPAHDRAPVTHYVPVGDPAPAKTMPEPRTRKPRRFPTAIPTDPVLTFSWPTDPPADVLAALDALARDVPCIGHSASLVRARVAPGDPPADAPAAVPSTRRVYPGRLDELESAWRARPHRPAIAPGAPVFSDPAPAPTPPPEWLVLSIVGGTTPEVTAAAAVGRAVRRALMAGYGRAGMGDAIPPEVSGHGEDGGPLHGGAHIAIVPLAFVGHEFADGRLMGVALVPPPGVVLTAVPGLLDAWRAIAPLDPAEERRVATIAVSPDLAPLRLAPAADDPRASLSPAPYTRPSRRWATATPMVLDRHLKRPAPEAVADAVAASCARVGLPAPVAIRTGAVSIVRGAPAVLSAGRPIWHRPQSCGRRFVTHAVIEFDRPVPGPVMLGAGAFHGLGLFRGVAS